ncbi:hypothetical protein INR49_027424%2C partial [Xyrichtys novacula]|uniref:Jacalin-type lectin domain-containing protein n=1 Tax=Xyrichtys novacula TaxID=13765 RepID=A0AAV1HC66_XYRNO|nr:hypothetical protein INR49_027424%2C partial [Xyrichtys novacula]
MQYIVLVVLLSACVLADVQPSYYSISPSVGLGSGTTYSLTGEGRITAIRVWELNNDIYGFQFRYGRSWSPVAGYNGSNVQEFELYEGETITQISGKYGRFIQWLVFGTSKGRKLFTGQPSGRSFNLFPTNSQMELRYVSGRYSGCITSIQAHWGVFCISWLPWKKYKSSRMRQIVLVALLSACVLADVQPSYYSFSPSVGSGSGNTYSLRGEGRITAIRVWEANSNYIYGIQFRYGYIWSPVVGYQNGYVQELVLFEGETITQISGKYSHYIQSLVFSTSKGRKLFAGQPSGRSFNFFPTNSLTELRYLSGRFNGGITSIRAHWAVFYEYYNSTGMRYIVLVALLSACVLADVQPPFYSFSPSVGSGGGTSYSLRGEGRITAIKVWERSNSYINGIQFRYDYIWSPVVGRQSGDLQELELHEGETIIQISGKHSGYIRSLVFITSEGRALFAGQGTGISFNMYPTNSMAELRFLSGRFSSYISSIGAHWGVFYESHNSTRWAGGIG